MAKVKRRDHKHFQLDSAKIIRAQEALRTKTETETIERALDLAIEAGWHQQLKAHVEYLKSHPNWYDRDDGGFSEFVLTEKAASWDDFLGWLHKLHGAWCFRGQRETEWPLQTSLERITRVSYSRGNSSGSFQLNRKTEQEQLLSQFQQMAPNYFPHLPPSEDLSGWLSLMQHHGVPTLMLDWTYSPDVAMYFALEEEHQLGTKRSAIWAIDLDWLKAKEYELLQSEEATSSPAGHQTRVECLNSLLDQDKKPVIVKIVPLETHERMSVQQGLFLWKRFEETPFFDQILMTMMIHPEIPDRPVIRKLEVGTDQRIEFLRKLAREKDIHRASLFPGLDGFCQSLKRDLEIKVKEEGARLSGLD
jgi:FRG domain